MTKQKQNLKIGILKREFFEYFDRKGYSDIKFKNKKINRIVGGVI